jgi:hypothetical protein
MSGASIAELRERAMVAIIAAAPRAALDRTRPIYHFRPPAQWMNDVHSAFYYRGWYHVFFQFHPYSDAGSGEGMGWGHTRSRDLVRWEFLPPALLPLQDSGERQLALGSACIRTDGVPMLFFTHTPYGMPENKREAWGPLPEGDDMLDWRRIDIAWHRARVAYLPISKLAGRTCSYSAMATVYSPPSRQAMGWSVRRRTRTSPAGGQSAISAAATTICPPRPQPSPGSVRTSFPSMGARC